MRLTYQRSTWKRQSLFGLLVVVVASSVVGLSVYGSKGRGTVRDVAKLGIGPSFTNVLGASSNGGLLPISAKSQILSAKQYITLTILNETPSRKEFSPGLQLFAVTSDGRELGINSLSEIDPLTGGPLEKGQSTSGTVVFLLNGSKIVSLKIYTDADLSTYTVTNL